MKKTLREKHTVACNRCHTTESVEEMLDVNGDPVGYSQLPYGWRFLGMWQMRIPNADMFLQVPDLYCERCYTLIEKGMP